VVDDERSRVIRAFMGIPGMNLRKAEAMYDSGYRNLGQIKASTSRDLCLIPTIGEKMAERILGHVRSLSIKEEPKPVIASRKTRRNSQARTTARTADDPYGTPSEVMEDIREGFERGGVAGAQDAMEGDDLTPEVDYPTSTPQVENVREKAQFFRSLLSKQRDAPTAGRAPAKRPPSTPRRTAGTPGGVRITIKKDEPARAAPTSMPRSSGQSTLTLSKGNTRNIPSSSGSSLTGTGGSTTTSSDTPMTGASAMNESLRYLLRAKGIGPRKLGHLQDAGYTNIEDLREASFDELSDIPGIGFAGARAIVYHLKRKV